MAYNKNTWATGDIITAEKLNNMEDGIAAAAPLLTLYYSYDDGGLYYDSSFTELFSRTFGDTEISHTFYEDALAEALRLDNILKRFAVARVVSRDEELPEGQQGEGVQEFTDIVKSCELSYAKTQETEFVSLSFQMDGLGHKHLILVSYHPTAT